MRPLEHGRGSDFQRFPFSPRATATGLFPLARGSEPWRLSLEESACRLARLYYAYNKSSGLRFDFVLTACSFDVLTAVFAGVCDCCVCPYRVSLSCLLCCLFLITCGILVCRLSSLLLLFCLISRRAGVIPVDRPRASMSNITKTRGELSSRPGWCLVYHEQLCLESGTCGGFLYGP